MAATVVFMAGAETGDLSEAVAAGASWSVSTANASILNNDTYHYRAAATASANNLDFNWYDYVADPGNGHIVSFDFELTAAATGDTNFFRCDDTVGIACAVRLNSSNQLILLDANIATLDTSSALSLNTKYRLIVYFQRSASADWQWWISTSDGTPVSEGSGTGADLDDGGTALSFVRFSNTDGTCAYDLNNLVLQSGCTASNTLGAAVEVICCASDGGTPTTSGDALDTGAWTDVQDVPIDANPASYVTGAQSGWIQADGTSTNGQTGPSGLGLTNIIAACLVAIPNELGTSGGSTEDKYPEATFTTALSNNGGASALDCVNEDQDGFATSWLYPTADDQGVSACNFPTPTSNPGGTQTIRVYCAKFKNGVSTVDNGGSGTPSIDVQVKDGAGNVTTTGGSQTVSGSGWISWTFDAADLTTADGSGVNIVITTSTNGGGPNKRSVGIDSIHWLVGMPGTSSTGQLYLGNSADGVTVVDTTAAGDEYDLGFRDWGAIHEVYSEDPTIVPSDSEYARVGFGVTAGDGGDSYDELLCMVLEAPNAGYDIHPAAGATPPQTYMQRMPIRHMVMR